MSWEPETILDAIFGPPDPEFGHRNETQWERFLDAYWRVLPQIGTCEECGKPTYTYSPRSWACSDRCYGRALGIDEHD